LLHPPDSSVGGRPKGAANDIEDGNHGTPLNGVTFAAGLIGQAFSFDGVDDVVTIPQAANLDFPFGSSLAIEMWVFRTSPSRPQHLAGKRQGCGLGFGFYQVAIGVNASPPESVPLNEWAHLAVIWAGDLVHHYVNGTLVFTGRFGMSPNSAQFLIGRSGTCAPFAGLIDDIGIYDRAISEQEIRAIYLAGSAGKCKAPEISAVAHAASFLPGRVAPAAVASIFGADLADEIVPATVTPLPITLQGTMVEVTDGVGGMGRSRLAPLFFVSPSQVNFLVADDIPLGAATVKVLRADGRRSAGHQVEVTAVAPGLFSANASGKGVAAALVLRVSADGSRSTQPIFELAKLSGCALRDLPIRHPSNRAIRKQPS
jgi:hypothetical protein